MSQYADSFNSAPALKGEYVHHGGQARLKGAVLC